ncbi:hypothetical protein ABW21_db0205368 [Orbilia brochopaga]|nr:hypothetical protein ABW21_db0205368 [Drechslerella brochopaga]
MRTIRFLPAAARGCRRRGTPLHASDHLWIPDSLVRDVFRTFCLRWVHASSLRRPSAKARKCYTFQPLRPNRAGSTSADRPDDDDAPPSATQNVFSWSFNNNYRGLSEFKRLPPRKPTTRQLDLDIDRDDASLFTFTDLLRDNLNHLITFGTSLTKTQADTEVLDSDRKNIRYLVHGHLKEAPPTLYNNERSLPAIRGASFKPSLNGSIKAPASTSEPAVHSASLKIVLDLPSQEKPQDMPQQDVHPQVLSASATPEIAEPDIPSQQESSSTLGAHGSEHNVVQTPSTVEEGGQVHSPPIEFKVSIKPPINFEALLKSSESSEAVETLQSIDLDKIDSPDFADELVLKPHERVQISPLYSQQDFEAELLSAINDQKVTIQMVVLMYTQFDKLMGIENFSNLPELRKAMHTRFGGMASEWLAFIFRHKSTEILRDPEHMPVRLRNKMENFEKTLEQITPDSADTSPILKDDVHLDSIWHKIKHSKVFQQYFKMSAPGFILRFEHIDRILDKAIARIRDGPWDTSKQIDVETAMDIFYFYQKMNGPLVLLFPRIVELFQAWMPHWRDEKYAVRLKKHDPLAPRDDSVDPSEPFKPELIRRIVTQRVRHHLLSTGSDRLEGKFKTLIPGLQRFLDCMPGHYVQRLFSTLILSRVSPTAGSTAKPGTPWTDAWTMEEILPFKSWVRRSSAWQIKFDDGDHLPALRDATDLFEKIIASKGHEAMTAYCHNMDDVHVIEFHLRHWVSSYGSRYYNDPALLEQLQDTMENIAERVRETIAQQHPYPGQPYAQAILSFFYLNIPTELFIVDIIRTLAFSNRTSQMLSCLAILQHFAGKSNGDVVFEVPKHAMKMALVSLRRAEPYEALRLLSRYHNRHRQTWSNVLISTAQEYPTETYYVLKQFLKHNAQKNIFNPQIGFSTQRGRPTRNLFSQLATRFALSENHTPSRATARISFLRRMLIRLGKGVDIRVTRALVVTAMIRSAVYRIENGTEFDHPSDLWKHGRIEYASRRFLEDSTLDTSWREGLTDAKAAEKRREFLEDCMIEVWREVKRRQDRKRAKRAEYADMSTTTV